MPSRKLLQRVGSIVRTASIGTHGPNCEAPCYWLSRTTGMSRLKDRVEKDMQNMLFGHADASLSYRIEVSLLGVICDALQCYPFTDFYLFVIGLR